VLLANPPELTLWVIVCYILLAMSAVLTLWSMVVYLIAAWPHLRPDSDQNSSK
jgi:CDP-diacylglycerol--glycerol-3-phosphate 3-phosphatidyltransferase